MDGNDALVVRVINMSTVEHDAIRQRILSQTNDELATILLPIIMTLVALMVIGTVGNGLVVYIYWKKLKSSAKRTFILALAWMDLTVCIVVIPFEIYDLLNQVMFYDSSLCKVMRVLEYSTVLSAGFVLVSVSFERYYFICKAFQEFTSRKAKYICVVCILSGILVALPSTMFAGSQSRPIENEAYNISGCECSMNSNDADSALEMYKLVYYGCLGVILLGTIVVFIIIYVIIGHLLWRYQKGTLVQDMGRLSTDSNAHNIARNISHENSSGRSRTSSVSSFTAQKHIHGRRRVKSAGTIIVFFSVTVVFVISFLPHLSVRVLKLFNMPLSDHMHKDTSELVYNFLVRTYLISNVSNPFIYSILNKQFKRELMKLCRSKRSNNPGSLPLCKQSPKPVQL